MKRTDHLRWDIRAASAQDIPFIYDTWLKCYKHGSPVGKSCRSRVFFDEYKLVVDHILTKSSVLIACSKDEQDVIYGYLVYGDGVMHFGFVKEAFRRLGIIKSLYTIANDKYYPSVICTHKTFEADQIFSTHTELQFNPFLLYQRGESS